MIGLLCGITTVVVYYLMLSQQQEDDPVYDDIGVSLSALSLHHDEPHSSNHSNTSWFCELNKLDLLNVVDSSQPVTMDTASKQIISPPKLKLHRAFCQRDSRTTAAQHSTINHKQYYMIIILSCLLSVSATCNVMLLIYCMVT